MFFEQPVQAFTNIYNSLKKGGELTFVCWNNFNINEFFSIPANIISKYLNLKIPLINKSPGPFVFDKEKYLLQILKKSNFKEIKIKNIKTYLKTSNIHTDTKIMLNIGTGARMIAEKKVSALKRKIIEIKLANCLEKNIVNKALLYKANFFLVKATK